MDGAECVKRDSCDEDCDVKYKTGKWGIGGAETRRG